ncbi:MAG: LacI family DNA-binding transcriptional regulator [Planktomarina sp.]
MTQFPMKEIAFQAGVSLASVDRYLHGRAGLRAATKVRIKAAIEELEAQYAQTALHPARLSIDVIMDAPDRFTSACREAFLAEVPSLRPASLRCRFHLGATWEGADIVRLLHQIRKRGSHGIVLKTRATQAIKNAAQECIEAGIPVLTFVTDLTGIDRLAYVGMDNAAAGRSVAWMMAPMLHDGDRVLLTLSDQDFLGEQARTDGFMAQMPDGVAVYTMPQKSGSDRDVLAQVQGVLQAHPDICAVYSSGGSNSAIRRAFLAERREVKVHAGHDLDTANMAMLRDQQLSFIVHHDLREDARRVFQHVLKFHRMLEDRFEITGTQFSIVTPFSMG